MVAVRGASMIVDGRHKLDKRHRSQAVSGTVLGDPKTVLEKVWLQSVPQSIARNGHASALWQ